MTTIKPNQAYQWQTTDGAWRVAVPVAADDSIVSRQCGWNHLSQYLFLDRMTGLFYWRRADEVLEYPQGVIPEPTNTGVELREVQDGQ